MSDIVNKFLALCDNGTVTAFKALENVLTNYLSVDQAEDFIKCEYSEFFDDEEFDEDLD